MEPSQHKGISQDYVLCNIEMIDAVLVICSGFYSRISKDYIYIFHSYKRSGTRAEIGLATTCIISVAAFGAFGGADALRDMSHPFLLSSLVSDGSQRPDWDSFPKLMLQCMIRTLTVLSSLSCMPGTLIWGSGILRHHTCPNNSRVAFFRSKVSNMVSPSKCSSNTELSANRTTSLCERLHQALRIQQIRLQGLSQCPCFFQDRVHSFISASIVVVHGLNHWNR